MLTIFSATIRFQAITQVRGGAETDSSNIEDFIKKSPKADLHTHITGSITPEFIMQQGKEVDWNDTNYPEIKKVQEIADHFGVDLNEVFRTGNMELLKQILDDDGGKKGFEGYQMKMALRYRLLYNNPKAWEDLAYDIAVNEYKNSHVTYFELRTSLDKPPLTPETILGSIHKGLIRAQRDCPGLKTGIIVSIMKNSTPEDAQKLIDKLIEIRKSPEYKQHIVGIDTAGQEIYKDKQGNPVNFEPEKFKESFASARADGLMVVNHAGEWFCSLEDGLESIRKSVEVLGAVRIGHALALGIDPCLLLGKNDQYGKLYDEKRIKELIAKQEALVQLLIEKGIVIEICLSSNLRAQPELIPDYQRHPLGKWIKRGLKIVLGTDNPETSHSSLTNEYLIAQKVFDLSREELQKIFDTSLSFRR